MGNIERDDEGLRELALFAGAGGGILGGKLLGWRTVCAVEIDEYARDVLVARQNDGCLDPFPIWDDVCTFDGRPWRGIVDVVSGGFPCQDISVAGRGAGIEGSRSGLWREMARIVSEVRPRFVFVENSPLLVGRGLARVLGDLAKMGYDARWGIVGADDVGAPHRRKRLWLLAHSNCCGSIKNSISRKLWSDRPEQSSKNSRKSFSPENAEKWWFKDPADLPDSAEVRLQGGRQKPNTWDAGLQVEPLRGDRKRPETSRAETVKSQLGRVANGVAHRVDRLKAIGNGQVPAVVALAWEILTGED